MSTNWNGKTIYYPSERIKKDGIERCCDDIMKSAKKLKSASDKIKILADILSSEQVLEINQQTYSKNLYDYSDELLKKYKTLHDIVCPTVKRWAQTQYNKEVADYNEYQEHLKREAELERQRELARKKQDSLLNI